MNRTTTGLVIFSIVGLIVAIWFSVYCARGGISPLMASMAFAFGMAIGASVAHVANLALATGPLVD